MTVKLYFATTLNGCIGDSSGKSDWVSPHEEKNFDKNLAWSDAVIMGRKTYEVNDDYFPFDETYNVVLTSRASTHKDEENFTFRGGEPREVLRDLEAMGHKNILIIGGQDVATQFLREHLIDEIELAIHPLILANGMEMFDGVNREKHFERIGGDVQELRDGIIIARYKER